MKWAFFILIDFIFQTEKFPLIINAFKSALIGTNMPEDSAFLLYIYYLCSVNIKFLRMKKVLFFALLILTLGMGATAKAAVNDETIDIPITTGDGNNGQSNGPRVPAFIPISCEYEGGVLNFNFSYDIGAITVTVTNDTTGQQWSAVLFTSSTASMNVSDDAGSYHIHIVTTSNKVYYGNYIIN